ncbi:MAG: CinA family protein [Proteobacteria bacterium]|nr:CinA family protein [Pseudomonadota bacterium]
MDMAALNASARALLERCKTERLTIATAESCTGGLIAAALTAIPGSSAVVDRGFITYSNEAKTEMLGVPADLIAQRGAVSADVARAMAEGALKHSKADLAVAVTGIAGPDGGSAEKPVGLVQIAAARRGGARLHEEMRYGDIGRDNVRYETVASAMALLARLLA